MDFTFRFKSFVPDLFAYRSEVYFCMDNLLYHNKIITVVYDKTGKKYNMGKGFKILFMVK